jgi:hypothetical protein
MGLLVETINMGAAVLVRQCENKFFPAELSVVGVEDDGALPQSLKLT